ncbi:hypothetical protein ACLVWU_08690 [Bdellovibrio sp. HCB290]|uniref:hypothetical protein n=1 Tax=Bdellovibrio sp. HCB290 TaxID=3394356 RepID=UPI0039B4FC65
MIKLLLLLSLVASAGNAANSFLGILENRNRDEGLSFVVRAVFKKVDKEWKIGMPPSSKTEWSVTSDGETIGSVETSEYKTDGKLSSEGLLKVDTPVEETPQAGVLSEEFGTWTDLKVKRPFVLTKGKFKGDPEQWKKAKPSTELTESVVSEFKKKFKDAYKCKNPDSKFEKWDYAHSDVKIERSYKSNKDIWLIRAHLKESNCDGPPPDYFTSVWYLIDSKGSISLLNTGSILVDAGDYDGDGSSELIFQIQRYNRGGYIIYWDNLKKNTEFTFSYH